ncbi:MULTISPECIES: hypothetical protein [unclassified Bradyrhizobium]|uniref:hypothetical protein n=1 Tax=unclassified Bradyrhizobium TaxID=2631580 RepID=UPI0029166484|nr:MULTISPECIES: hypothetical protein [unclassified Bradyrhizobium]
MTKVSQSFYSAAVGHHEIDGVYLSSFAIPGDPAQWVTGDDGKPKLFRSAEAAELAGFRVMAAKLNKARDIQSFLTKGRKQTIKTYHAPERKGEPTAESVFGKK